MEFHTKNKGGRSSSWAFQFIKDRYGTEPIPRLSKKEERDLIRKWLNKKDHTALSTLVKSFFQFIVFRATALPYVDETILADLVQEGVAGLHVAINKFDLTRKTRLSSYAVHHIDEHMQTFLNESNVLVQFSDKSLPARLGRVLVFQKNTRGINSRIPTEQLSELARVLGRSEDVTKHLDAYITSSPTISTSLTQKVTTKKGEPGQEIQDTLIDPKPSPEEMCAEKEKDELYRTLVKKLFAKLTKRERDIIRKRIMTEKPITLDVLAKKHDVSPERIRQIEKGAMAKLRAHSKRIKEFRRENVLTL